MTDLTTASGIMLPNGAILGALTVLIVAGIGGVVALWNRIGVLDRRLLRLETKLDSHPLIGHLQRLVGAVSEIDKHVNRLSTRVEALRVTPPEHTKH